MNAAQTRCQRHLPKLPLEPLAPLQYLPASVRAAGAVLSNTGRNVIGLTVIHVVSQQSLRYGCDMLWCWKQKA